MGNRSITIIPAGIGLLYKKATANSKPQPLQASRRKKDNESMKKNILLHKKRKERPAHIQAHLAAPKHKRTLRSQKSIHFAFAPKTQ